ncbi:MAG: TetR/AcrR family transcriptional regulator [Desulfobacterales bacterium]|nr:TetR/AcrR family transcriptional regulator [Desulfobacterales bacterium]
MAGKKLEILHAATILFAQKGYNETSIAELARITGVAEGTIFYHFKTKIDLLLAILDDVKEHVIREFDQYMGSQSFPSGMTMLEEVIAFFLYLVGHSTEHFMLIQRHYPHELARHNSECRRHLEGIYNTLVDFFEGAIRKGQDDGSIRPAPTRKTALIIFSMVNGLVWLRFNDLYDTGSLHQELITACRHMMSLAPINPIQE